MQLNKDLVIKAGVGFLIGECAEIAIECFGSEALDGELDLPDHGLSILGATVAADKTICDAVAKKIRSVFGKSWSKLSEKEWEQFSEEYPDSADYLKQALMI